VKTVKRERCNDCGTAIESSQAELRDGKRVCHDCAVKRDSKLPGDQSFMREPE
jgi:formylmethanofuran dehydrogenase subunit E